MDTDNILHPEFLYVVFVRPARFLLTISNLVSCVTAGFSIAQVQQSGRWKSPLIVLRYGKHTHLQRNKPW